MNNGNYFTEDIISYGETAATLPEEVKTPGKTRKNKTYEDCIKGCKQRAGDIRKICKLSYRGNKNKKELRECIRDARQAEKKCMRDCAPLYPVA
ncbi:MAG: hypothetical protein AB4372_35600 [Xenococcus sp. (in: cyanobacteria)]